MSAAIDIIQARAPNTLRSIFISCDPARDTPQVLRSYLDEFHPSLIGLTGTWEQTKNVCKQYRVYFSTPKDVKTEDAKDGGVKMVDDDYLVDHSIYFYVMDPEGDFVECIGRQDTPESAAGIVLQHVKDWKKEGKVIDETPLPYLTRGTGGAEAQAHVQVGGKGMVRAVAA
jgi:protein SCO1